MRPPEDNSGYEYIAVYVDDLAISANTPKKTTHDLQSKHPFMLKGPEPPTHHMGCTYRRDPDGTLVAESTKYIKEILETSECTFGSKPQKARPLLEE